jgi:N-acetylneuraminate synthase/N,N'-diacetyllegionaminate synthase
MKNRTIIIAEAGVNHNGDIEIAKRLIDVAVEAKVDFIKFQSFIAEKLVSPKAKKADYQHKNIGDNDDSQFNMLKRLELSHENHHILMKYCSEKKIKFLSTAFDIEGLHYLNHLDLPLFKVPSGEITNYPYLKTIAQFGKPVILSTGMSTEDEIRDAINIFLEFGLTKELITVLHCNTEYPTPMKDVNLNAMISIRNMFQVKVGYSDHTLGIEIPIAAVALGATVIEKHFTLDRNLPGPDHLASLEPNELISMVNGIRNIELAINGDGIKKPANSELKNILIARKSIHVNKSLTKGHIICENDIIALRPGDGISPMEWNQVIGKTLIVEKQQFDKLQHSDFL